MIFHSQPLSEFVLTCAQGIRANLCPGHSRLIHSQASSEFVPIRVNSWLIHSQCPETPNLPILPFLPLVLLSLVPCALPPFVPLCLCGYESITQNKPNSPKPKTTVTYYATKLYANTRLRPTRKNKPKRTQFPAHWTTYDIRYTRYETHPRNFSANIDRAVALQWSL